LGWCCSSPLRGRPAFGAANVAVGARCYGLGWCCSSPLRGRPAFGAAIFLSYRKNAILPYPIRTRMFDMPKHYFRSQNLRVGRVSIANQIYLITTVTHQRRPLFQEYKSGRCVVNALMAAERSAVTLSYVVMPDHLHWLMQLKESATLSRVMQFVKSSSAKSYNQLSNRHCPVWSKGFHDRALRREEDVQDCARYIVANPLRSGIVDRVGDYPLWDAIWL